jgi:hypothetical protein
MFEFFRARGTRVFFIFGNGFAKNTFIQIVRKSGGHLLPLFRCPPALQRLWRGYTAVIGSVIIVAV